MELSRMRVTFRRYLRHAVLARLLMGRTAGEFFHRHSRNRFVKLFWSAGQWHLYMRHRFSLPSFLAARAALGLLQGRDGLILDAPCGMGHLSHYLAKMADPGRIVAMDLDPESAYAARRFFMPDAAAVVVWDMNEALPLRDGSVGAIFCLDALHFVAEKRALADEFMRVLRDDGVIAILHAHNSLQYNPSAGMPLSPDEYADLFRGRSVRMYPEDHFLRAQLLNEPIDLTQSAPPEDLKKANALMLIVAKDPSILSELTPTGKLLACRASNPRLGDLYTARNSGGKVTFERSIPPTLRGEYPNIDEVLPERWVSAAPLTVSRQSPSEDREDLLEHNVFIDLPDIY
jgi:SAM-dependent methyltransferase